MYNVIKIQEELSYVGGSDRRIALFESAYPVPRGVSYNSYVLKDEKTAVFDTVDDSVGALYFENLEHVLGGKAPDYLIIHHMEPDHSASFSRFAEKYPSTKVVCNQKIAQMLQNFYGFKGEAIVVKDGDTLSLGKHTLRFVFAPMVHWPEVMFSYDETSHTLFSADAFGTFGALGGSIFADEVHFERDFLNDARRYYMNIVGKYGVQVQNVLKKASALDIRTVCPLHGPVWRKDFGRYLEKYDIWSRYEAEEKGVAVFYASIYGHVQNTAEILASELARLGIEARVYDTSVTHVSELLSEAFRYSHSVFLSCTYNGGIFSSMEALLAELKSHNFQNRKYAVVENGSWAPQAGGQMEAVLSSLKNMTKIGEKVSFVSAPDETCREALVALAKEIEASF